MAMRMRGQSNTLLHSVAACIQRGTHKSLDCIMPAFKKMYALMHYAYTSCAIPCHKPIKGPNPISGFIVVFLVRRGTLSFIILTI
jgi:hypothetical protein